MGAWAMLHRAVQSLEASAHTSAHTLAPFLEFGSIAPQVGLHQSLHLVDLQEAQGKNPLGTGCSIIVINDNILPTIF